MTTTFDAPFRHAPPSLRTGLVRRARLVERINQRFAHRLTVVVAGAGYGKTTLLAQALAEHALDPAGRDVWLQTTTQDRDPAHFIAGLGRSLTGVPDSAGTIVDLIDLLVLRAPESVALVIDDAHLLDGSDTWAVIATLLDNMPTNAHLVLGSRTMPELSIRRLQAEGRALVLDQRSLGFDAHELTTLADSLGLDAALAGSLPSWPALAVLTGAVGHHASLGYLWEEILRTLPPARRDALALLARFELIDDDLVRAVAGGDWSAAELTAGLPLIDELGDQYRFHALWQMALADVVPRPALRPAIARGAETLLARGELIRAIAAFSFAGETHRMHEVIRHFASLSIGAGLSRSDAQAISDLLSPEDRAGPIGLCLEAVLRWTADEALPVLYDLLEKAREADDDAMRALAWWRIIQLSGEIDPTSPSIPDELAELADDGWPLARSAVALVRCQIAQQDQDVAGAIAALDDLVGPDPLTRRASLASAFVALGQPEMVSVTLDEILAEGVADPVAAQAVWMRGDIDPDLAWPIASGLPDFYSRRQLPVVQLPLLGIVTSVALAAGDDTEACRLADAAMGLVPMVVPRAQLFARVADALVALVNEGDGAAAQRFEDMLADVPLGSWPAWAYLGALAPIRALVPDTERLDDIDLGPSLRTAVAAGRAITDLRSGRGAGRAVALPWGSIDLLRVHVPRPMLCELAVAASASAPDARAHLVRIPGHATWIRRLLDHPDRTTRAQARTLSASYPLRPGYDLRIEALGGIGVTRSDGVAVVPLDRRGRLRQLLAHLALEGSVSRTALALTMWPDLPQDQAANNLRVTLSKLLDVIEPDRPRDGAWFIRADTDRLHLADEGITIDVKEFDEHIEAARSAEQKGSLSIACDRYSAAHALYRGELIPGIDDPTVTHERTRLHVLAYSAACRQAELQLARGEPEGALRHAVDAQRIDPLGQRAHRVGIRCQIALGAASSARDSATGIADLLRSEGIEPERETMQLIKRLSR